MEILKNKKIFSKEVKASFAYILCSILQKCISFFTLPFFSRILTTEQYAQCIIYSSWSNIISIFITLNLAYGSFSKAMIKYKEKRNEYISSVQSIFIILCIIVLSIYFPFREIFNVVFELPTNIIIFMFIDVLFQNIILLWYSKNRFEFKYFKVVLLTITICALSTFSSFIFVINSENKGIAKIIGTGLPNIFFGIVIMILNYIRGKNFYSKEYWKYSLNYGIPLIAYYVSQYIFNTSDRIMISYLADSNSVAMYGMANNLALILTFVLNSINNSYVPWLYNNIENENTSNNKKITNYIAVIFSLMLICVIWFTPEIIMVIGGEKYMPCIYAVAPIAISMMVLFYSQLFINIEFYYEVKNKLIYTSIASAISNIILNLVFIPVFGYIAASYTTLISYLIFAFSNYLCINNKKIIYELYDFKRLFTIFVLFICSSFLGVILYDSLTLRIIITIIVTVIIIRKMNILEGLTIFKDNNV